jgi:hypothetical protein
MSPNGRKALDYSGTEHDPSIGAPVFAGEMDESVVLLNLESRVWCPALVCGTGCSIQVADWIGEEVFAVCGETEIAGGGGFRRFLFIDVFDLDRDRAITYLGPEVADDARSRFVALYEDWKRTRFPEVVWDRVGEAEDGSFGSGREPDYAPSSSQEMPIIDVTSDTLGGFPPEWPNREGSCYLYPEYIVIAWGAPNLNEPVAIVRPRDQQHQLNRLACSPDSLPGDFVVRNEWAEYFAGMWGDLLLIDSGTSDIRSLILFDVPSRAKVLSLDGAGETEGWIDEVTVRIWILSGTDMPRSLCPDIPAMFAVGVDSLFALNLQTLKLRNIGPWRCRPLQ